MGYNVSVIFVSCLRRDRSLRIMYPQDTRVSVTGSAAPEGRISELRTDQRVSKAYDPEPTETTRVPSGPARVSTGLPRCVTRPSGFTFR